MNVSARGTELGINQWFHYEDYPSVERAYALMKYLGVKNLRTGISWADYHRPGGKAWYDYQMRAFKEFNVLLSIWHTPPSISENGTCSAPPKRLEDYGDFIHEVCERYSGTFELFELWNEPNNYLKWDFYRCDPKWSKFSEMIALAARAAREHGERTVLGGMIPVDPEWLRLVQSQGAVEDVDIIAIHGFPQMWWDSHPNWDWYRDWHGWQEKVAKIQHVCPEKPIWITETGLATVNLDTGDEARHQLQVEMLERAAEAPVERVYWYSLIDLDPRRDAIEGFHVDENEYHLGLVTHDGRSKPALRKFKELVAAQERLRQRASREAALGTSREQSF